MNLFKKIFFFTLFCFPFLTQAQIDVNSVMGIPTTDTLSDVTSVSGFAEGNMVYISDEDTLYVFDGANWVAFLDSNSKDNIDNELIFEDANYYYVSVAVNTTDWMVTRYDRSDINAEASAMGTGAQPSDLASVSGLSY